MHILTNKQALILESIKEFINTHGEAPTLREIGDRVGIKTKVGVLNHLIALEKKGYIARTSQARGITILADQEEDQFTHLPILGFANAGQPLAEAEETNLGSLKVDKAITTNKEDLFALIVKGDSMNKKQINGVPITNGNYVVVDKEAPPQEGDVVLAIIDNAATIKTLKKGKNSIILRPESTNSVHHPIYIKEEVEVYLNGKVVAVLER